MPRRSDPILADKTYRLYVTLPRQYWRVVQLQAAAHYMEGRMVIEDILKAWCADHLDLLETEPPVPDESPDDVDQEAVA